MSDDPDTIYEQRPPAVLTFGTPESPSVSVRSAPIVTIRQAGQHGSELLVVQDGRQMTAALSWGHLMNLNAELAAAIARFKED